MRIREVAVSMLIGVACVLVTVGMWKWSEGLGLVCAGVLLAGWTWLVLGGSDS